LLVVHAHPDDETITMGGTLARYHAEGVRTVVVTCTLGDLGEVRDPGLPLDAGVAALRERELGAAIRVLGVSRLVTLGYADSGMAGWASNHLPGAFFGAPLDEAAQRLAAVIRQERPQVVVGYDATGGYGHPDHVKAHDVTVAAVAAAAIPGVEAREGAEAIPGAEAREGADARHAAEVIPGAEARHVAGGGASARPAKLYFVRFPLSWSRDFVRSLRAAGIAAPGSAPAGADAGPDIAEIGVPDGWVTTAVDVRDFVSTKLAALACHASQMPSEHFLRRMQPDLAERVWAYEYYSREFGPTTAGPGETESDFFSGLD
jgi:N-acetyl-1-D-myo-inositol-2-amino-2-deoxy-alpha-D-glucopyranoside deacetylase